jgi:hypothetical protein
MITPSFGLTATERVLPKLALDFTTASLDSRVTFTRTTGASNPATYVNSSGVITAATNNEPRFDYDPVTLACKGLLIEEARTNLALQSQDIATTWSTQNTPTLATDVAVAPDGTTTADSIQSTAAGAFRRIFYRASVPANSTVTASWFIKKEVSETNYGGISLAFLGGTAKYVYVAVNAVTGATVAISSDYTPTIRTVDFDDYWRISVTATDTFNNIQAEIGYYATLSANFSSLNNGAGSARTIWGAQLETGAFATSYIPTTTTALTRNADVAVMTGTNFSDWWQATRGGATVLATPSTVSGIRPLVQFDDNTANEIIALRGNTTNPELYIVDGGTPQAQIDAGTIAANTAYNLFGVWNTNDCAAKVNNGPKVFDTSATIPTVTQMRLGSDGTNYLNGTLATVSYYSGDQLAGIGRYMFTRRKNKVIPPPIF